MDEHQLAARARERAIKRRFLVVHEDGTALLAIHRILKFIIQGEAVGARSVPSAIERLREDASFDAVLLHWSMPKRAALGFVSELATLGLANPPSVLAFAHRWPEEDLARALQLGVDGLLALPVNPLAVERELDSLAAQGRSSSIQRVLSKTGARLLMPNPALWEDDEDDTPWRQRMQALAQAALQPAPESDVERWAMDTLAAVDEAATFPVGPLTAAALRCVMAEGRGALSDIANQACVSRPRLEKLSTVLADALLACGIKRPSDRAGAQVLQRMLEIVARRPDEVCWTAGYLPLRAAALNLYEHPVSGSPSAEYLATRIAELLSVERDEIWRYGITNLRRLAAHLVDQLDELRALDLVRLTILACSIRGDVCHDAGPAVDTDRLKAVRAAFGRTDQEEAKRLVELAEGDLIIEMDLGEMVAAVERVVAEVAAERESPAAAPPPAARATEARAPTRTSVGELKQLLDAGQVDSALEGASGLPDDDPRAPLMLDRLASELLRTGRAAEGLPLVRRALELQPRRLPLHLSRARLALAAGEVQEAAAALAHLEAVAPGFGDSVALREQLRAAA